MTMDQCLKEIEDVYLNPAGVEFNRAVFQAATREGGETLLKWHTRARELFLRAYPGAECDNDCELKDRFILGLQDKSMSIRIKSSDTYDNWTYNDLLNRAQKIHGSALIVHQAYTGKTLSPHSVNSMEKMEQEGSVNAFNKQEAACHHCGVKGHFVSECAMYKKAIDRYKSDPRRPNPQNKANTSASASSDKRSWGKGNFGGKNHKSGQNRFKNNKWSTRRVNAIDEQPEDKTPTDQSEN